MKHTQILLFAVALCASALCQQTMADTIAYDNSTVTPNQNWKGNLGLDFNVNKPITVTSLGAFFGDNINNLSSGVVVAIFDLTTSTQVGASQTINSSNYNSIVHGDAFVSLGSSPILLAKGSYSVVTFMDPNYNEGYYSTVSNPTSIENDGGGAISFVGTGRYDSGASLDLPTGTDGGPSNRYDAGTFQYVVPLPSAAWGGLGLIAGLFAINTLSRRRIVN